MSLERQGLDRLLKAISEDVLTVTVNSAWVCVDTVPRLLRDFGVERQLATRRYAIWRHTGNVYRVDGNGAVEEDPWLEVTPL